MPLSFATSTGALFVRLGKLGALVKNLGSYQATQYTAMTDTTSGVVAQFNAEPDIQALMGSGYPSVISGSSVGSICQNLAQRTLDRMIFRDSPRLGQTLTSSNTLASLQELIRQMKQAGATVLAMTVTSSVGNFQGLSNQTGNAVVNISTKRPEDGLTLENAFSEVLTITCTSDSYTGGASAGNETLRVTGAGAQGDYFAFNWPLGSNCSAGLSAINGNADNSSGNLLTNSGFENWTGSNLDNWIADLGTAGTDFSKETGITYDGSAALKMTGDGATLTELWQKFNLSTGTSGQLQPLTQYSFCIFCRRDGVAAATGVLTIDLVDGGETVIQDENGAANSFTIDLTALTTVYTAYTGSFRTPSVMPSQAILRLRQTTALESGRAVYFDKASWGVMGQLYPSGPYMAVHAGSTPLVRDDFTTAMITNSRGAAGTLNTFQTLFSRLFPNYMLSNGLLLPSSSSPSLSDSGLIA